eukprot:4521913-Pyramimonas_sp.AAC.1
MPPFRRPSLPFSRCYNPFDDGLHGSRLQPRPPSVPPPQEEAAAPRVAEPKPKARLAQKPKRMPSGAEKIELTRQATLKRYAEGCKAAAAASAAEVDRGQSSGAAASASDSARGPVGGGDAGDDGLGDGHGDGLGDGRGDGHSLMATAMATTTTCLLYTSPSPRDRSLS